MRREFPLDFSPLGKDALRLLSVRHGKPLARHNALTDSRIYSRARNVATNAAGSSHPSAGHSYVVSTGMWWAVLDSNQ